MIFTVCASVWAWFKNNYVTVKGKKQKEVLQANNLIN
ncbi:phage holin [Virgibacillus salarius]|nr:phage holin [Virgibacillus salarius]WBX78691.1 phage holin [Virgibacillus salarius]